MKKKRKFGGKLLSFLLTLAMVVGLMPGMSLTVRAATDTYTALKNNATVVQFNGYNWYIIEDNSTEGTVTLQTAVFGGQQGRLFRPCRAAISGQYSENHQQGEALPAVRLLL